MINWSLDIQPLERDTLSGVKYRSRDERDNFAVVFAVKRIEIEFWENCGEKSVSNRHFILEFDYEFYLVTFIKYNCTVKVKELSCMFKFLRVILEYKPFLQKFLQTYDVVNSYW